MPRRPSHNARPTKKSKQAKARLAEPISVAMQPVESNATTSNTANSEPPDNDPTDNPRTPRRSSSRTSRPYQHGKQAPTARMASSTTSSISREQEFAFIRNDLRRMFVTAGILVVVMIVLLILIDR